MTGTLELMKFSEWPIPFSKCLIIAGPCSAETEEQVMQTAMALKDAGIHVLRAGIWKGRTRPGNFEGVGAVGLKWLKDAGRAAGLPVTTEVAAPAHVEACLEHGIDILWIGARTTTNPFAVQAIADSLKGVDIPVLVKNPINPDIDLWIGALERMNRAGIKKLAAIHRGFSIYKALKFRSHPIWRLPMNLKKRYPQLPLLCDPSHICGNRELLLPVAQKALHLHFDGLMLEVHIRPEAALSDAQQQLTPEEYKNLIAQLNFKDMSFPGGDFHQQKRQLPQALEYFDNHLAGPQGSSQLFL